MNTSPSFSRVRGHNVGPAADTAARTLIRHFINKKKVIRELSTEQRAELQGATGFSDLKWDEVLTTLRAWRLGVNPTGRIA